MRPATRIGLARKGGLKFLSLILTLGGLQLLGLGIIGEYIWRIFDEVSRRPEAVIEEIR